MSKVTSKLQVTLPKALADRFGIRPGDEIDWEVAGDGIRILTPARPAKLSVDDRIRLFDRSTQRQREREASRSKEAGSVRDRGWKREDLYERGGSR
jgi:AbrB family looped-hinge helix DNA binding protein